jgi:hypothetical protein
VAIQKMDNDGKVREISNRNIVNTIRLDFYPLPHPYSGEPASAFEKWGKNNLDISAENGQSILSLIEIDHVLKSVGSGGR